MTFEDFLDMMSVFSENAPKSVKVSYAFKIYRKYLFNIAFLMYHHFDSLEGIYRGVRPGMSLIFID